MINRNELVTFLDDFLLTPCPCKDASNNGLQVEGGDDVERIVFGVDACLELFEKAVEADADAVVVHHGLSWNDSLKYLTGLNAARVGLLLRNEVSLYAAHLPLDMHPRVGHNAVIAERLAISNREPFFKYGDSEIGWRGELATEMKLDRLVAEVDRVLKTVSSVTSFGPTTIRRVGIVSGGAPDALECCAAEGLDCLITGEMDHTHYHTAKELGVNVIAAGHYRSEVPGLEALQ
ncbi:MAG: Nif3-like dinuclear metal center hexameric protein, partial [Candidatus Pacebacteria bacterium]|nr:Nif3-like dinuclear metal center hexameric protein [Candidatus Paceibacterota bacterium]